MHCWRASAGGGDEPSAGLLKLQLDSSAQVKGASTEGDVAADGATAVNTFTARLETAGLRAATLTLTVGVLMTVRIWAGARESFILTRVLG